MVFKIDIDKETYITAIKTPSIPNKKNQNSINEYITSLNKSLFEYLIEFKYNEATIIFINHYCCSKTRFIDSDNQPFKLITDVLQRYLLKSDSSALVTTIQISEQSITGEEYAMIIIIPRRISENNILKYIGDE